MSDISADISDDEIKAAFEFILSRFYEGQVLVQEACEESGEIPDSLRRGANVIHMKFMEKYGVFSKMHFEIHGTRIVIVISMPFLEKYNSFSKMRFKTYFENHQAWRFFIELSELESAYHDDICIHEDKVYVVTGVDESVPDREYVNFREKYIKEQMLRWNNHSLFQAF